MAFFGFEDLFGGGGHGHGGFGGPEPKRGDVKALCATLGVSESDEPSKVKKAYMKLARTHHPDKGGDPEKFKEIQKAYEILGDPQKRELYAKYGEEGLDPAMVARRKKAQPKGEPTVFPLKVPLEQLYNGATRKLNVTRQEICGGCDGKGGTGVASCQTCSGRGIRIINRQIGPGMVQRLQAQCDQCQGQGEIVPAHARCKQCNGRKTKTANKMIEVYIAKGMKHKEQIKFEEEGNQMPGTNAGDIIVVLQQQPHPFFRRSADGPHLVMSKHISLAEALTGFSMTVTHLDGRKLVVSSKPGEIYQPDAIKAIMNEGMPVAKAHNLKGHLYIELKVDFPAANSLDEKTKQALIDLLPGPGPENETVFHYVPKKKPKKLDEGDMMTDIEEKVELENVDLSAEKAKYASHMRAHMDEDDDDDEHGGVQQVRCPNQ